MNKKGLYVNHILRGIQEALETTKRGQELIEAAEEARRAQAKLESRRIGKA